MPMHIRIIRMRFGSFGCSPVKLVSYIKECRQELGKVIWPNRKELTDGTLLVIGVSLAVAAFLGAVDYLSTIGFEQLLRLR